ncbi:MAG: MBL fold metallo-hydrolase [Acidobacteriota bacterium]|nr:MBL fold metallo-hydrolase [Acidobacteriota bacterium]
MKIIPLSIPTPFYIGDVNVYLIKEDPLTLIDVGPKTVEAETVLREKLNRHGVKFSDIKRILLTHAHEDHCGLVKKVRDEANDAQIFVHEWESGHLFSDSNDAEIDNLIIRAGVPETVLDSLRKIYRTASGFSDSLNKNEFSNLKENAEIEFASGVLKVLHTPGHTPGSCCFLREANRTLIAGDTILKRITPNPLLAPDPFDKTKRFPSLGEYLVSLAKIKSYAPTLVYGGHFDPIDDFDEIFHRYIRSIDDRQRKIIALISNVGATAFEIAGKLFPAAINQDFHRFLAVSETVAHLDYAESENKIAVEYKDGAEFYRQI